MKNAALNPQTASPLALVKKRRPTASVVFDTYWRFAAERQFVFNKRIRGESGPWTNDPVLQTYKFTNAYRASDRVSQYLIKDVIYAGDYGAEDTIFRILLFKIFNKIETWELLRYGIGEEITLANFDVSTFSRILETAKANKRTIYSAAYIMPSGTSARGRRTGSKHQFHLELLKSLDTSGFYQNLSNTKSMKEGFELLLSLPSVGSFLAYQYITDLNYSEHFDFSEQEFVIPGPGARDGIRKCFQDYGDFSETDIIKMMSDEQNEHFSRLGLSFQSLWGRPLQLIDCQNLFCEVDKYSRVMHPDIEGRTGRTRIKQKFLPKNGSLNLPWYPPKWGINQSIERLRGAETEVVKQKRKQHTNLELFA